METILAKMKDFHISPIAEIERECFSQPWSEGALREELSNPNAVFTVAMVDGKAAGYMGFHDILGEGYVCNVAVSPQYRRQGVAAALVKNACDYAERSGMAFLTLEVRQSNAAAIALYEKAGFRAVGIRRKFYVKPNEDALIMTRNFRKIPE